MKRNKKDNILNLLLTPLSSYVRFVEDVTDDKYGKTSKVDKAHNCPFLREIDEYSEDMTILFGIS